MANVFDSQVLAGPIRCHAPAHGGAVGEGRVVGQRAAGDHAHGPVAHLDAPGAIAGFGPGAVPARGKADFHKLAVAANGTLGEFTQLAIRGARELPDYAGDQINLKRILGRRREQEQVYFNQVAGRFDRIYGPGRSWQAFGHLYCGYCRRWWWPTLDRARACSASYWPAAAGRSSPWTIREDRGIWRCQGEEEPKEPGVPPRRLAKPAGRARERGFRDPQPGVAPCRRTGQGHRQHLQDAQTRRPDHDPRPRQAPVLKGAANSTATAGPALPKVTCTAGWKRRASRRSRSASSPAKRNHILTPGRRSNQPQANLSL